MQYQLTYQFIKDIEYPCAEFHDLHDAEKFISVKIDDNKVAGLLIIYRLYSNQSLFKEYNKNPDYVPSRAQYADKNQSLPKIFAQPYSISTDGNIGNDTPIAKFCKIEDARIFADLLLDSMTSAKDGNTKYALYQDSKMIEVIDPESARSRSQAKQQAQEKKKIFRPTPFSMKLRMGPSNWLVDEDDNETDGEAHK